MKDISDAVVKHFNATPDNVVVTIVESLKINKAKAACRSAEMSRLGARRRARLRVHRRDTCAS
jgi:hypothetical protein